MNLGGAMFSRDAFQILSCCLPNGTTNRLYAELGDGFAVRTEQSSLLSAVWLI